MGKFMNINKIVCKTLFIFSLLIILFVPQARSGELKKIIVMPFDVYSNKDKTIIRESFYKNLLEELKKEKSIQIIPADEFLKNYVKIDEGKAVSNGKSAGADFVITGNLTQFGESLNVDAKIFDVDKKGVLSTVSAQGKGMTNLGDMAEQLKTEISQFYRRNSKNSRNEFQGNRK